MTKSDYRGDFDIPRPLAYFNAPQIGPMPNVAVRAGAAAYQSKARPWEKTTRETFFDEPEQLRGLAAGLFGTETDNIALVPAASYGLAVAARNLTLNADDEILILEGQFPSNVYTWQAMADRQGAKLVQLDRSANQSWTECLLVAMNPKTKLIACGQIHWIDGGQIDLEVVSKAAKANGAALVLDLTQSLGMMDIDLDAVDPDFVVAAAYKWLLGPYACGFLYVALRHQCGVPLEENWINRKGSEDFTRLIDYQNEYQAGARRFDMGERSNFQIVPGAIASLEYLQDLGLETVRSHAKAMNEHIERALQQFSFRDETPDRAPHYLSLTLPDIASDDFVPRLRAIDVHVAQRGPRLRIGAHIYNTNQDIEILTQAVAQVLR